MYALKPPPPQRQPQPRKPRRVASKAKARARKSLSSHRSVAYETTAKLMVNVTLSVSAIVALIQLLPYHASQTVKLQELQAAVHSTSDRVQRVQTKFSNYFDPNQARENMQDLTDRIDPTRRQIVWQTPGTVAAPKARPVEQPASDDEN